MSDHEVTPIGLGALNRALELVKLVAMAEALGVQYQLIQQWRTPGRAYACPAEHCIGVERATEGRVRCEELRPDINWAYLRGTKRAA